MTQWFYVYRQWLLRELQLRFRTSVVGAGWLVLQPLVHILLFTLVFYQFFQIRWPAGDGSVGEYGLQVFIGLSLYTFMADVINRSPGSIWSYPYLVTKVRFPLTLLPAVVVGASAVQLLLSLVIAAVFAAWRAPHLQALLLPVALVPLCLQALGLAWLLGAAGVYLRDIGHLAPSVSSLLLFLTPIFYPASMVPKALQWLVVLNPLAWTAEAARGLLMHGQAFGWVGWAWHCAAGAALLALARWFFMRVQPGFADVL
ncbi:ABC transporter permease [Melaminivora sp.]|uniref:ABC transporter permease n=1 Tax=Melaminivora sp. TaxID=1933032 RepID=UPI0028A9840F|nr:ABC transporter permease [Melaminivora sp.]